MSQQDDKTQEYYSDTDIRMRPETKDDHSVSFFFKLFFGVNHRDVMQIRN